MMYLGPTSSSGKLRGSTSFTSNLTVQRTCVCVCVCTRVCLWEQNSIGEREKDLAVDSFVAWLAGSGGGGGGVPTLHGT